MYNEMRSLGVFTRPLEEAVGFLTQKLDHTAVSRLFGISWAAVGSIAERIVAKQLHEDRLDGLSAIGIDEFGSAAHHRYLTVVTDHDRGRVIWVGEGKSSSPRSSSGGPRRSGRISANAPALLSGCRFFPILASMKAAPTICSGRLVDTNRMPSSGSRVHQSPHPLDDVAPTDWWPKNTRLAASACRRPAAASPGPVCRLMNPTFFLVEDSIEGGYNTITPGRGANAPLPPWRP
jgi:hypothetical protein